MAAISLATWIQTKFDQLETASAQLSSETISQILSNHRKTRPDRVFEMINGEDYNAEVDSSTGQLILTLRDITGLKTTFSHDFNYSLHPDGVSVTVDGTAVTTGWEWHPISCDLVFSSARTEDAPVVKVTGNIIDLRGAFWEAGSTLAMNYATLPSVRDREFEFLWRRIQQMTNQLFGSRVLKRR